MSEPGTVDTGDLPAFAASVAHEIRTPLSAVAGEVAVALRRDRSAAEYREILERIAAGISELVEISGDLTMLGDPAEAEATPDRCARLDRILSRVRARYKSRGEVVVVAAPATVTAVAGDEARLVRAVTLTLEHAVRYRRGNAPVVLRAEDAGTRVCLMVEALPDGFWPPAWTALGGGISPVSTPLRLRAALRILDAAGATLTVTRASGIESVRIALQVR